MTNQMSAREDGLVEMMLLLTLGIGTKLPTLVKVHHLELVNQIRLINGDQVPKPNMLVSLSKMSRT